MSKKTKLASLREQFIQQYGDYVFDKGDVESFLEPYLGEVIDVERLIENERSRRIGIFIQNLRDDQGRREATAFDASTNPEDSRLINYAFIDRTRDLEVLNRQEAFLTSYVDGLLMSVNKVREAKHRLNVKNSLASESGRTDTRKEAVN